MSKITFYIAPNQLFYFITRFRLNRGWLVGKKNIATWNVTLPLWGNSRNEQQQARLLELIGDEINKISHTIGKASYRLIISPTLLMQHQLTLPSAALADDEIVTFIQVSLAKIFHTKDALSFDYYQANDQQQQSSNQKSRQHKSNQNLNNQQLGDQELDAMTLNNQKPNNKRHLTIFAYYTDYIECLIDLFNQSGQSIEFVGIPRSLLSQSDLNEQDIEQTLISISITKTVSGINLLPWRQTVLALRRKNLLFTLWGYLFIGSGLFGYCNSQQQALLNQQRLKNRQIEVRQLQKDVQLAHLIERDKQQQLIAEQIAIKAKIARQLTLLSHQLSFFTEITDDDIWLESLDYYRTGPKQADPYQPHSYQANSYQVHVYQSNTYQTADEQSDNKHTAQQHSFIRLTGGSFFYSSILQLSAQLAQQPLIKQSQIEVIKQQDHVLHYQIKLAIDPLFFK